MDMENLTYPDGYTQPSEPQIDVFKTWLWYNNEICNECYTKVRDVGEEITAEGLINTHTVNTYYERTAEGTQEHTAFELPSDRFGQCFCKNCGSDTSSYRDILPMDELVDRAKNIIRYFNHPKNGVPYQIDGSKMGAVLTDLKRVPENQGFDTEILAMATIVALANE